MTLAQQSAPARVTIASIPVDFTAVPLAGLIDACVRGEGAAWVEFIRRYHSIIAVTVSRVARHQRCYSPQVVDDLVAETYLKICADGARVLRQFRSEHENAMFGFLKVVAKNAALDYLKKHKDDAVTVPLAEYVDPAPRAAGPGVRTPLERGLLLDKIDAYLRLTLPPETRDRDRIIFRLRRQGWKVKQIAALPLGLSEEGVEAALHRLFQLVRRWLEGSGPDRPGPPS